MDVIHTALKWVDYNRGFVIGVILAIGFSVWILGCPATTQSVLAPDRQVDAAGLEREIIQAQGQFDLEAVAIQQRIEAYNVDVEVFNEKVVAAADHLAEQYEQRAAIVETLGGLAMSAATGGFSPATAAAGVLTLGALAAAGGLGVDNIRKRKVIRTLKNGGAAATEVGT